MVKTARQSTGKACPRQFMIKSSCEETEASFIRSPRAGSDILTTAQGGPLANDQNRLKVRPARTSSDRGFSIFREKIFISTMSAFQDVSSMRAATRAHGYFETYESLAAYSRADIFQGAGEKTPVCVRFSTVAGSKGSFDLARDVRGFAVKF